jgi:signal transduction histidine kinase
MLLTEFIRDNHQSIVEDWVKFAGSMLPWAEGMDAVSLRDHAEELLKAVVADMKTPQTILEQSEKSKGNSVDGVLAKVGQKHASDRLESGISLKQLVSEFRALRASVLSRWEAVNSNTNGEVTRFNEAIDEALAKSTSQYSETLSNTREEFLGILGHDLRNPLGAIVMGAGILTECGDEESIEVANSILTSAERMSRMVNDLLDLTRTRLGSGIPILPKPIDLRPVCEQVVQELRSIHKDVNIVCEFKGRTTGNWDGDRLAQTVSNLLTNAINYGDRQRPVSLHVEEAGEQISIRVHNFGPPIPPSALKTIFAPMSRGPSGHRSPESNSNGLGLGLYIASEIVSAHGGKIEVKSGDHVGTTFTLNLPYESFERSHRTGKPPQGSK